MRRDDAEQIALAGGEPARELVAALIEQVAALRAEVDELKRQINRDSSNSSMAPSQDPPRSRAERRAAARVQFKRSARTPGGQPGHEGKSREMAAPERVDERFEHLPSPCECGHCFSGDEEHLGDPLIHQKWELPPIIPLIFEHRLHRLACPSCGKANLAELSAAGISPSAFGPRMEAHIAVLAGVYRLSRRQVQDVVCEIFGCPISTGALDSAIMRMSRVLADPWAELREAVRAAEVVHADETSWRLRGAQHWLWLGASALAACYRIDPSRSQAAAKELLGCDFGGFVISDRYAGYHFLDLLQQQLCWAHVVRQLVDVSERAGATGKLGTKLVEAAREVIASHRRYLEEGLELTWLAAELAPLRERIETLLEQGARGRHERTARFCAGLLEEYEALWTFCEVPGIEPTNNAAERALRHVVIMRKTQLGTHSDEGSRWIERICSVKETCRLQGRSALGYLVEAAEAAHARRPGPSLFPP